MLRNPSAVVTLARNTGFRLTPMDSTIASCFEAPARRDCCKLTSRCTQFATTIINTMVGAGETGRGKRKTDPYAKAHRRENGKDDHRTRCSHPRPAPGKDAKDQGHEQKAHRQEDHLAFDRGFQEGLVDHGRADEAEVHAGETFFRLRGDRSAEFGDLGHGLQQAVFRQFDGDVYDADIRVAGDHAARDTRVGRSDGADPGPHFGPVQLLRVDEVPHIQVVSVRGRVLKVGERIDAPRIRCPPSLVREPDGGGERAFGRGVAVVRNDQEDEVLVLPVCILQRFQRQKLRIVVVEEDAVIGREFEPCNAAPRGPRPGAARSG